jgi:hypothetical protein
MANVFLDYAFVFNLFSGSEVWAINFDTTTKTVNANWVAAFDPIAWPPEAFEYIVGEVMYDQCFGPDKYQVVKTAAFPYGQVIVQTNASSCVVLVQNSALAFFKEALEWMGDTAAEVCSFTFGVEIFWTGSLQVGTQLTIAGGNDLDYSNAGWFRVGLDAVRVNSTGEVIDIQAAECTTVPSLPELPDLEVDPILHLPTASSIHFVKDEVVTYKTDQNTLFAQQSPAGVLPPTFHQTVKRLETLTVQFGSTGDEEDNVVKVYNAATGAEVAEVPTTKVQQNINLLLNLPAVASKHPDVLGVQVYFPAYPFPEFAEVGNLVNINSGVLTGQYAITAVQEGKGSATGYRVLVINSPVTLANPIPIEIEGKYNALPYDVYEALVPFATAGRYYLQIEAGATDPLTATSEPVVVQDDMSDFLEIRYTHDTDNFGAYYGNELTHKRWIKSRMYQVFNGGEKTVNRQTDAKLVKVDEYLTKSYTWQCFGLPPYLVTQLAVAMAHASVRINGIQVQTEEEWETEYYLPNPLANMSLRVEETAYTQRVKYGGLNDSDSFLKVNEGLLKINSNG